MYGAYPQMVQKKQYRQCTGVPYTISILEFFGLWNYLEFFKFKNFCKDLRQIIEAPSKILLKK